MNNFPHDTAFLHVCAHLATLDLCVAFGRNIVMDDGPDAIVPLTLSFTRKLVTGIDELTVLLSTIVRARPPVELAHALREFSRKHDIELRVQYARRFGTIASRCLLLITVVD